MPSVTWLVLLCVLKISVVPFAKVAGERCAWDPPLPEEISNTEVTPEGKEAFISYVDCLKKECQDMNTVVNKALGKGIPGHASDCVDGKEKFTCELDIAPFWEAWDLDTPLMMPEVCGETCEACGTTATKPAPKPAPTKTPSPKAGPKPTPAPAPTEAPREDSSTDIAMRCGTSTTFVGAFVTCMFTFKLLNFD